LTVLPGAGLALLAAQSETQDASCLPALKVSDIEPTVPVTPVQFGAAGESASLRLAAYIYIYIYIYSSLCVPAV